MADPLTADAAHADEALTTRAVWDEGAQCVVPGRLYEKCPAVDFHGPCVPPSGPAATGVPRGL